MTTEQNLSFGDLVYSQINSDLIDNISENLKYLDWRKLGIDLLIIKFLIKNHNEKYSLNKITDEILIDLLSDEKNKNLNDSENNNDKNNKYKKIKKDSEISIQKEKEISSDIKNQMISTINKKIIENIDGIFDKKDNKVNLNLITTIDYINNLKLKNNAKINDDEEKDIKIDFINGRSNSKITFRGNINEYNNKNKENFYSLSKKRKNNLKSDLIDNNNKNKKIKIGDDDLSKNIKNIINKGFDNLTNKIDRELKNLFDEL